MFQSLAHSFTLNEWNSLSYLSLSLATHTWTLQISNKPLSLPFPSLVPSHPMIVSGHDRESQARQPINTIQYNTALWWKERNKNWSGIPRHGLSGPRPSIPSSIHPFTTTTTWLNQIKPNQTEEETPPFLPSFLPSFLSSFLRPLLLLLLLIISIHPSIHPPIHLCI